MSTRREFLGKTLTGVAGGAMLAGHDLFGEGRLAWPGPIGLEIYTVRDEFAKDPAGTLKRVAAIGYKEAEIGPGAKPAAFVRELRAAGLTAPSGYFEMPKNLDGWKKAVEQAHDYDLHYIVVGDNPKLGADEWKRRAAFFNQCGRVSLDAGIQFCYHAHYHEFARVGDTSGYDIMLTRCDPKLLKMEMDIFWVTYAGADPLHYWRLYPGRFPLLHIKDLRKGVKVNSQEDPPSSGPSYFVPVGQGRIDWSRIFAHAGEAGAKHIFVEQDRCDMSSFEAIEISYHYLRNLRLS